MNNEVLQLLGEVLGKTNELLFERTLRGRIKTVTITADAGRALGMDPNGGAITIMTSCGMIEIVCERST